VTEPTERVMFWAGEVRRLETELENAKNLRNHWIRVMRARPATLALIALAAGLSTSHLDRIISS
jgi:hypothetical protein